MNFLAHLWLAERAKLPLSGAILGDWLHGALPADMPAPLAASVRLHRRIDAHTDRHPSVEARRRGFGPGTRRYAGILLDILYDHALAVDWDRHSSESLESFANRAAHAVEADGAWFERAGTRRPQRGAFAGLLLSYAQESGIELAVQRTASRLRRPQGLLDAMGGWRQHMPGLRHDLPGLLAHLEALGAPPETKVG